MWDVDLEEQMNRKSFESHSNNPTRGPQSAEGGSRCHQFYFGKLQ